MKFRKSEWLDMSSATPKYGIQSQVTPGSDWMNLCEGSKPCIYDSETERDLKIKELRKRHK